MTTEQTGLRPIDYQFACDSQSACNLSGLAHTLANTIDRVWVEAREAKQGTDYVNKHPIVRLYVTQMLWLAFGDSVNNYSEYSKALQECTDKSKG